MGQVFHGENLTRHLTASAAGQSECWLTVSGEILTSVATRNIARQCVEKCDSHPKTDPSNGGSGGGSGPHLVLKVPLAYLSLHPKRPGVPIVVSGKHDQKVLLSRFLNVLVP